MPAYSVRNENFRDEALKYAYPFEETSALSDEHVSFGTDLLIDAVFYLKTPHRLPLHISVVDGTHGEADQALFIIADAAGANVGSALVSTESLEELVINPYGMRAGVLVFNQAALTRFIGSVSGKVFPLLPEVARFAVDVCHVSSAPHVRYITAGTSAVTGFVRVVAGAGVRFRVDAGVVRVDLDGEILDTRVPVRSVNGVASRSIWLQGHPEADLRTAVDNAVVFSQSKDKR